MGKNERIGVASPSFVTTPIEKMFEVLSKDFTIWEITSEYKHHLPAIEKEILRIAPSYDIKLQVHAPFSDINIASLNDGILQASLNSIEKVIESCRKVNISMVTIHPGFYSPISFVDKDVAKRRNVQSLVKLGRFAKEHSVRLALENMPAIQWVILETAEDLRNALETAEIGMCFDLGHANTTKRTEELIKLKDKFVNVHVHDNFGEKDAHLPVGIGNANISRTISELKGYRGNYILEIRDISDALESKNAFEKILTNIK
ncbi:MAG: sugar phosphate isomerase/epimerase family protein [Thermoplasmata archaeon]